MIKYEFKKGSNNYVDIASYRVKVEKSTGLIGKPNLKNVNVFEWDYLHGSNPDLRNRRYKNKEFSLTCWMTNVSKQKLFENFNSFIDYFSHDDLLFMKVTWDGNDGNTRTSHDDPHASKGIYNLVYLASVSNVDYKFRFGKQIVKFTMNFIDPYPMKQVLLYNGTSGGGVDYDIISDTEIDIFTEDGISVYDVLNQSGHINVGLNKVILVCGDVVHCATNNFDGRLVRATDSLRDVVTTIYSEI